MTLSVSGRQPNISLARVGAIAVAGAAPAGLGAVVAWKNTGVMSRVSRAGALAGAAGITAALITSARFDGTKIDSEAKQTRPRGALSGAAVGAAIVGISLGGLAAAILPNVSAVRAVPAALEIGLYGAAAGGALGAIAGAVTAR